MRFQRVHVSRLQVYFKDNFFFDILVVCLRFFKNNFPSPDDAEKRKKNCVSGNS